MTCKEKSRMEKFDLQIFAEEGTPGADKNPPGEAGGGDPGADGTEKPQGSPESGQDGKTGDEGEKTPSSPVALSDLKLPEIKGFQSDQAKADAFLKEVNERGLDKETAQWAIDKYGAEIAGFMAQVDEAQASIEKERADLRTAFESDAEIGKGNLEDTKQRIAALLGHRRLVPAEDELAIRKLMDETNAGVHPAFGRLLVRVEKALGIKEGAFVEGSGRGTTGINNLADVGDKLYGKK